MAVDLYTPFFSRVSAPKHDLDLPSVVQHDNNPLNSRSDLNLNEENTQQVIVHSGEAMKRKRNERIALSEKIRRQKMKHFLSTLQSLLPVSTSRKVARNCIIEETGRYIKNLQIKAQELQKKKAQLLATRGPLVHHNSSGIDRECISLHVDIDIYSSETVIIRTTASRMPRSLCKIYEEVEAHGLEIDRALVYRGNSIVFLYFHTIIIMSTDGRYSFQIRQSKPCLKAAFENNY